MISKRLSYFFLLPLLLGLFFSALSYAAKPDSPEGFYQVAIIPASTLPKDITEHYKINTKVISVGLYGGPRGYCARDYPLIFDGKNYIVQIRSELCGGLSPEKMYQYRISFYKAKGPIDPMSTPVWIVGDIKPLSPGQSSKIVTGMMNWMVNKVLTFKPVQLTWEIKGE